MAKKKAAPEKSQANKMVKFSLTGKENDRVRIAAAISRKSVREFCHDLVVAEAERITAKIELPD